MDITPYVQRVKLSKGNYLEIYLHYQINANIKYKYKIQI